MTKTILHLYVDGDLRDLAKIKGINMSNLMTKALQVACDINLPEKDEELKKTREELESKATKLGLQLAAAKANIDELNKMEEKKKKEEESHVLKTIYFDKPAS